MFHLVKDLPFEKQLQSIFFSNIRKNGTVLLVSHCGTFGTQFAIQITISDWPIDTIQYVSDCDFFSKNCHPSQRCHFQCNNSLPMLVYYHTCEESAVRPCYNTNSCTVYSSEDCHIGFFCVSGKSVGFRLH